MTTGEGSQYLRNSEVAKYFGVTKMTVWRWQRGQNTRPGRRPSDARIRLLRKLDLREADIPE